MGSEGGPFRCEIVGANHPHRGAVGTCNPQERFQDMVLVTFESAASDGEKCAYAAPSEIRQIAEKEASNA